MIWCLSSAAVAATLLALAALTLRLPRPNPRQFRPIRLLRGCLALIFLGIALSLLALILALSAPLLTAGA
jgi:fatty acid desaturase